MDKKKIQFIITSALIAVFVLISINSAKTMISRKKMVEAGVKAAPAINRQAVAVPAVKQENKTLQESLPGAFSRDPFKRQGYADDADSGKSKKKKIDGVAGIMLTGIVYDEGAPSSSYCIINGEPRVLKDKIGDFTVTGIKEEFVVLFNEKEQKEYKLRLWEEQPAE